MSLLKVYISEKMDEALFEAKVDFNGESEVVFIVDLSNIRTLHQKNLFSDDRVKILCNVDKVKQEILLDILNQKIPERVVWLLSKIDKRTKLYKKLSSTSNVEFCKTLSNIKAKKLFIKGICKQLGIPSLVSELLDRSGESRSIIYQEALKAQAAKKAGIDPVDVLIDDTSSLDCLYYIDSLLKKDVYKAIKYLRRMERKVAPRQISHTLLKRLLCYMFLCRGDPSSASSVWKLPNNEYFYKEMLNSAKTIGFQHLSQLYLDIQDGVLDFYVKNPYSSLRKITWQFCKK